MTDCYDALDNNCDYILDKVINKHDEATCSELEDLYLDLHDCGAEYSCAEYVELDCLAEELYDDDSLICPIWTARPFSAHFTTMIRIPSRPASWPLLA